MSESASVPVVDDVYSVQAKITTQQSLVRQLKKDGASPQQINDEVSKLTELRNTLISMQSQNTVVEEQFNRKSFDELIVRKMYVIKSFEIHNGPSGLFDYGPPACALKSNVLSKWRQIFVLEESMLEMVR